MWEKRTLKKLVTSVTEIVGLVGTNNWSIAEATVRILSQEFFVTNFDIKKLALSSPL